jgi:porin
MRLIARASLCAGFVASVSLSNIAHAQSFSSDKYLTGGWDGLREQWYDKGVDVSVKYMGDFAHNVTGGQRQASSYTDQIRFGAYLDLGKLASWKGATFRLEIVDRNGNLLNQEAGLPTLMQVQAIHGNGSVARLTQFSLEQELFDDHMSIKLGRLYATADFFSFPCAFENLSFCGALPGYISNGWYSNPLSNYGAVAVFKPANAWRFKYGVYDVNPQNRTHDQGLSLTTRGKSTGRMTLGEVEYMPHFGNGLDGDYRVAAFHNSSSYPYVVGVDGLPANYTLMPRPLVGSENGYYFRGEQQLFGRADAPGIRVFLNYSHSDADISKLDELVSAGFWWTGLFSSRPDDRLGLAIGRNHVNGKVTVAEQRYNTGLPAGSSLYVPVQSNECPVELNYTLQITPAASFMPVMQYIRNANGVDARNGVLFGARVTLVF